MTSKIFHEFSDLRATITCEGGAASKFVKWVSTGEHEPIGIACGTRGSELFGIGYATHSVKLNIFGIIERRYGAYRLSDLQRAFLSRVERDHIWETGIFRRAINGRRAVDERIITSLFWDDLRDEHWEDLIDSHIAGVFHPDSHIARGKSAPGPFGITCERLKKFWRSTVYDSCSMFLVIPPIVDNEADHIATSIYTAKEHRQGTYDYQKLIMDGSSPPSLFYGLTLSCFGFVAAAFCAFYFVAGIIFGHYVVATLNLLGFVLSVAAYSLGLYMALS